MLHDSPLQLVLQPWPAVKCCANSTMAGVVPVLPCCAHAACAPATPLPQLASRKMGFTSTNQAGWSNAALSSTREQGCLTDIEVLFTVPPDAASAQPGCVLQLRGLGSGVAATANWSTNAVISQTFLTLTQRLGGSGAFWLYAVIAVAGFLWTYLVLPETAGGMLRPAVELCPA